MQAGPQRSALEIDLTRLHRRTVTSFYSNLVTRPTGRAVRVGVEQQLVELTGAGPCLSILDFSQVRVLDYSCADEIVAKLLLNQRLGNGSVEVYFLARGLKDHHVESVEAVLDRHRLLLAAITENEAASLVGPSEPLDRLCWDELVRRGGLRPPELAAATALTEGVVNAIVRRLLAARVVVPLPGQRVCPVPQLAHG
ncbi:MAG: hypothetical protein WD737_10315 [Gemmatimonadota bacterium]